MVAAAPAFSAFVVCAAPSSSHTRPPTGWHHFPPRQSPRQLRKARTHAERIRRPSRRRRPLWSDPPHSALPFSDEESSSSSARPPPPVPVRVYDGVFPHSACLDLVDLAEEHSYRATNSDGSSVFFRPPSDDYPFTPLESAVDSVLTALGDDAPCVEYWSRIEHLNMDAHADIDEELLEDGDELTGERSLRCPTTGHVLYMDVEEGLRGPTCVFPDRLVGWDGDGNGAVYSAASGEGGDVSVVTVPAVRGRLLRFDGRAMHAVPRPSDRWLLSDDEEKMLRTEESNDAEFSDDVDDDSEGDDEWADEDGDWREEEDDDDRVCGDPLRAVLLFNTWTNGPPRGVDRDPATGAPPSGIEILGDESDGRGEEDRGGSDALLACNDASEWREVRIEVNSKGGEQSDSRVPVRVNLMGSRERRVHPSKFARLLGPNSLKDALLDPLQPAHFILTAPIN